MPVLGLHFKRTSNFWDLSGGPVVKTPCSQCIFFIMLKKKKKRLAVSASSFLECLLRGAVSYYVRNLTIPVDTLPTGKRIGPETTQRRKWVQLSQHLSEATR